MKCIIDYPLAQNNEVSREVTVLAYDRDKYCSISYQENDTIHYSSIKLGYLFTIGKNNKLVNINVKKLLALPFCGEDVKPTRKQTAENIKEYLKHVKEYAHAEYIITAYDADGNYLQYKKCKQINKAMSALRNFANDSGIGSIEIEKKDLTVLYYNKSCKSTFTRKHFNVSKLIKQNGLLHIRSSLQS